METLDQSIQLHNHFPKLFPRKGMETIPLSHQCAFFQHFPKLFPRKGMETLQPELANLIFFALSETISP